MVDEATLIRDIAEKVEVNLVTVGIARAYILELGTCSPLALINGFLSENSKSLNQSEMLNDSNREEFITLIADYLSWNNAARRAINLLHSEGILYVTESSAMLNDSSAYFVEGHAKQSAKFNLSFVSILEPVHNSYQINPIYKDDEFLKNDSDILLRNLQLSDAIGTTVTSDLQQATECYKKHLYLPAAVMIGRATEGVWSSLALAFIPIMSNCANKQQLEKMLAGQFNLANLMESVHEAYINQRFDKPLIKESDVRVSAMKESYHWCSMIRSHRNAVHPTAEPPVQLNQENTTSMLLQVSTHFPRLDKIIQTANQLAQQSDK